MEGTNKRRVGWGEGGQDENEYLGTKAVRHIHDLVFFPKEKIYKSGRWGGC